MSNLISNLTIVIYAVTFICYTVNVALTFQNVFQEELAASRGFRSRGFRSGVLGVGRKITKGVGFRV